MLYPWGYGVQGAGARPVASSAGHSSSARMSAVADPATSEREREQSKLRADLEVVRRYGESHSRDFVDVLFENEPSVRLVALMTGEEVEAHGSALHRLVRYPNQLEIRHAPHSREHLEEICAYVAEINRSLPGVIMGWGIAGGRVEVQLRADQEELAHRLLQRFTNALTLQVGAFFYPPTATGDEHKTPAVAPSRLPVLSRDEFGVTLDAEIIVASGKTVRGTLRVHNYGGDDAVIDTNGTLTATVIDAATGEIVGGFVGWQTAPLVRFRVSAGETVSIPLLVGTASTATRLGYALPPGRWEIEVPVSIEDRGTFRTPPLPLVITPSEKSES